MAALSEFQVQSAFYSALVADAAVTALVSTRVYDGEARENATFPYIIISEIDGAPFDSKDTDGEEMFATLDVYSKYGGNKEARQIMSAVNDALDQQSLTVTGHDLLFIRFASTNGPLADPDPDVRHGVIRFRVITESV